MDCSGAETLPGVGMAYKGKENKQKNNPNVFHLAGFLK